MKFLYVIIIVFTWLGIVIARSDVFGTVLFTESDVKRNCYGTEEIALLTARMMLEDLVPHKSCVPNVDDNGFVNDIVDYFRLVLEVVRNRTTGKGRHIMLLALTDTLGGYMNKLLIPAAKYAYYAGKINYASVLKLYELFGELKAFLRTSGLGWSPPPASIGCKVKAQELPLPVPLVSSTACKGLIFYRKYKQKQPSDDACTYKPHIIIPMPFFDSKSHPSAMAIPFKVYTLRNIESKSAAYILIKYYIASRKCLASQNADDESLRIFESDFSFFLNNRVSPHLNDQRFYSAFGGVLRIVETLRRRGVSASSESEYMSRISSLHGGTGSKAGAEGQMEEGKGAEGGKTGTERNEAEYAGGSSEESKKKKSNIILFAALVTIFFWFLIGALFICCRMRAAKQKREEREDEEKSGSGKGSRTSNRGGREQSSNMDNTASDVESDRKSGVSGAVDTFKNWLGRCVPSGAGTEGGSKSASKQSALGLDSDSSKTGGKPGSGGDTTTSSGKRRLWKSKSGDSDTTTSGKTPKGSRGKGKGSRSTSQAGDTLCEDKSECYTRPSKQAKPQECKCETKAEGGRTGQSGGDSTSIEDSGEEFATGRQISDPSKYYSAKFACHTSLTGKYQMSKSTTTTTQPSRTASANKSFSCPSYAEPLGTSTPQRVSYQEPQMVNASQPDVYYNLDGEPINLSKEESKKMPLVFGYDFNTSTTDDSNTTDVGEESYDKKGGARTTALLAGRSRSFD